MTFLEAIRDQTSFAAEQKTKPTFFEKSAIQLKIVVLFERVFRTDYFYLLY